jgi:hypothetical protein
LGQGQRQGCLLLRVHVGFAFKQAQSSLLVEVLADLGRGRCWDAFSWVCMCGVHTVRFKVASWWRCTQAGAGAEAEMPPP